jgi:hypothetical protein
MAEGRSPMEVGRRKKEEAVIAMVSAIKNVLTVLAVAIKSAQKYKKEKLGKPSGIPLTECVVEE